jgi:hypothetical protein
MVGARDRDRRPRPALRGARVRGPVISIAAGTLDRGVAPGRFGPRGVRSPNIFIPGLTIAAGGILSGYRRPFSLISTACNDVVCVQRALASDRHLRPADDRTGSSRGARWIDRAVIYMICNLGYLSAPAALRDNQIRPQRTSPPMPTTRTSSDHHAESVAVLDLMESMDVAETVPIVQAIAQLVMRGLVTLADGRWLLTAAGWAALANHEAASIH